MKPDRRARFQREAEVLASLNHPNIAAIYGLEESDGVLALVLELVEGPTLADRIARGPMAIDEALAIARQVGEALEAAHEQGVVHRDLKPANIKVRHDGTVKVLDFGLAKALGPIEPSAAPQTMAPTMTSPAMTGMGVILGTAAYMAPEQARGTAVDRRADIWAFGCVLFEMLTGRRAFEGDEVTDTLATVLRAEPNWSALPAETPPRVRALLRWCLLKNPQKRLPHIGLARFEIDDGERAVPTGPGSAPLTEQTRSMHIAWVVAGLSIVVAVTLVVMMYIRPSDGDARLTQASLLPPEGTVWAIVTPATRFALSPDGSQLAFLAMDPDSQIRVWVRSLDAPTARSLAGTENAIMLVWSSDSRSLVFSAEGKLRRIDATGGPALALADMNHSNGATWNQDDVILFRPTGQGAIHSVSASGGAPIPITTINVERGETAHWQPFFLPDGRHFLYHAVGGTGAVYVGSLEPEEPSRLLIESGSNAQYASGYLLFMREATLMAQPFDVERLELTGEAVPLAEEIQIGGGTGRTGAFSVSQAGKLVYQTGNGSLRSQLTWFDRAGGQTGVLGDPGDYGDVELSPDGTKALVSLRDPARNNTRDLWIFDLARGVRTRFTFDPADETSARWSPDASRIVFASNRRDNDDLYQKASSGVGSEDVLLQTDLNQQPQSWSPDGRLLMYQSSDGLWVLPLFGDRKPFPLLQTPFREREAQLSADGRWIVYTSNESGRNEVYAAPFPKADGKWQVSTAGGSWPRWRRDGTEIFYLDPDNRLMSAQVRGNGAAFEVSGVQPLFLTRTSPTDDQRSGYDVTADGQRFLVNTFAITNAPITLVVNWPTTLNR